MPRYYFHLHEGAKTLIDGEGQELDCLEAVADQALVEARALLSQEVLSGRLTLNQRIDVEDQAKTLVYSLQFADAVALTPPPRG